MFQGSAVICRHHWLLSGPKRGVIHGICKNCRATKDYPAGLEDANYFTDHQEGVGASDCSFRDPVEQLVQKRY